MTAYSNNLFLLFLNQSEIYILVILFLICLIIMFMVYLKINSLKKLKSKNKIYETMIDSVPSGVIRCAKDDVLTIKYFNNSFLSIIGYTKEEMINLLNNKLVNIIYKNDLSNTLIGLYDQLGRGNLFEFKNRLVKKDGSLVWVLCRGQRSIENYQDYLYCVILNINDTVKTEYKQKIDEERYRIVAESSDSVIFEFNVKEKTAFYTNKYKFKFGEEPITKNIPEAIIDAGIIHEQDLKKFISGYSAFLSGSTSGSDELRIKKANGEYIWCQLRYSTIFDEKGVPLKAVGKIIDIDKQKKETENLIKANQMDSFTGLYNKTASLKLIDKYLNDNKESKHALFFIDIDNFKSANDNFGHIFGDTILLEIASRIKKQFRYTDLVGRIGGDEFVVLLKDFIDEEFIIEKADALCKSINDIRFDNYDFSITTSAGISVYPKDGKNLAELYEKADIALYGAKNEGKNIFKLYSTEIGAKQYLTTYHKTFDEHTGNGEDIQDHTSFLLSISETLHDTNNLDHCVNLILEKLGKRFSVDRVYIFESTFEGLLLTNTYEWCAPEITSRKNKSFQIPDFNAEKYKKYFNGDNVFYCQDVSELNSDFGSLIDVTDVTTFIQCSLIENSVFKGFIGFDVCKTPRLWKKEEIETLSYTAKMLGMFLTVKRLDEIVLSSYEKKKSVLDNIDFFAYVVDAESYNIIYMNKATYNNQKNINIGNNIFGCICGSTVPCEMCEVGNLKNIGDSFTCEKKGEIGEAVKITAIKILWDNDTQAILIYCKN